MARRFSHSGGRKIDFKQWVSIPSILKESAVAGTFAGGSASFAVPATVLRCRSEVLIQFDETRTAGDQMDVAIGLAKMSTDAAAGASLPDPIGEVGFPWLFWKQVKLECISTSTTYDPGSSLRFSVDTKAMRKVKPDESIIWLIEFANPAGAPVTQVDISQSRLLIGT